jgi:hypothetical protein
MGKLLPLVNSSHEGRCDDVRVVSVFRDGTRDPLAMDDVGQILVLAPLVAVGSHGEAWRACPRDLRF